MSLIVRDGVLDDALTILAIARNPLVAANQYRLGLSAETWFRQILSGQQISPTLSHQIAVIELDGIAVGYIHHIHHQSDEQAEIHFGWNLHPGYWGKGVMPAAMSQLIEKLLREENCKTFVAECFRENARCIRVMEKLGFRPVPKSLYDRFVDAVSCLCLKWVLKYELKPEECQCSTITTHLDARPA